MTRSSDEWLTAPYETVAVIYDRLMGDVFLHRQAPLLDSVIETFGPGGDRWADVACGTGAIAFHLAERGWRVRASDISEAMLAVARQKAARRRDGGRGRDGWVAFERQDMRTLRIDEPVDAVSCFFDSVNIMTRREDLVRAFRAAARALRPGGIYVFDAVTPEHTRRLWDYCDQTHEGEGFFGVWQIDRVDPRNIVTVRMRWFIQEPDGRFRRADEAHRIRGYDQNEIEKALGEAGLTFEAAYDGDEGFLEPPSARTMRIDYVARKV